MGGELVVLVCEPCGVFVDCGGLGVVVIVFWSVQLFLGVDEWVHFYTHSEDAEFFHDGFGVCSGWYVLDESDDFLLCFD